MDQPENKWELPEDFLSSKVNYDDKIVTYEKPPEILIFNFQTNVPAETDAEAKEREAATQEQIRLGILKVNNPQQQSSSNEYDPLLKLSISEPVITILNNNKIENNIKKETSAQFKNIINELLKPVQRINNIKVGKNDPCPCGSGKKYKKCHGR